MAENRVDKHKLRELADRFAKAWGEWRFNAARFPDDETMDAANQLTDFMLNYSYTENDGQSVEVWQDGLTRSWYIGTPAGTNVGPIDSREVALEIAATFYSHGPADDPAYTPEEREKNEHISANP